MKYYGFQQKVFAFMKSVIEKQTNKKTQAKAPILHKTNLHLTQLGPSLPSVQRRKDIHPHIHTFHTVAPAIFLFYCSHNALHVAGIPENLRGCFKFPHAFQMYNRNLFEGNLSYGGFRIYS